ncbi:MAG: imidazole glycerol phosphate synthase subunit HisH [Clostridia bacterium]|nr:imidazole glycerol phosphate synthase subunit HisH [Clostridia bacterium]
MIAIIDYGAGNLQSVKKAFDFIGAESVITDNPEVINACDRILLPGVGSFGDAMDSMHKSGLVETVKQNALSGKPFLGICLGLQLLFEESEESPGVKGLGIFKGKIKKFSSDMGLKIPHIGWNSLEIKQNDTLFKNIPENSYVYFVHSYYLHAEDENDIATVTNYGIDFHSAVGKNNIFATQFHPEKSGDVGLQILRNFASMEVK